VISTTIIKSASALVFSLYGRPGAVDVSWAYRENGVICWAVVKIDGFWYLILRGSVTRDDWLHDFEALAIWVPELASHVHPGFHDGMRDILADAMNYIGDDPFVICGHSLGAARAAIATAYAIAGGKPPLARITWGEPRPGFSDLAHILTNVPNYNFVNGGKDDYDRVTDVPFTMPLEWYCAGAPHLFVNEPPISIDIDILFRWHNFALYNAAMNKLPDGEM
jgi:pimeloyl-ACP methyl ester carboxylesterase